MHITNDQSLYNQHYKHKIIKVYLSEKRSLSGNRYANDEEYVLYVLGCRGLRVEICVIEL